MKKHTLAFIDLETTGLNPATHEIIEVAGIIVRQVPRADRGAGLDVVEEFELKVKPTRLETAEPDALRINGYNDADWLFAADLHQAMKLVAEKTKDCILVGLNIAFDAAFLEAGFRAAGVANEMHFHTIEIMSMAFAKLYDDQRVSRFSLRALAEYFGIENPRAHTALADIRTTFEVYKRLLDIK